MMDFLCKWWDFSHKKNVSQGFNKLRRCCCRWSGLDTYDFSDFRLKSEGMWGVYSYNIPIGDCMLYTMVYGVINCWFILIKSLYLFTWNRFLQQIMVTPKIDVKFHLATPPCTSADGSGIASGVVLMPKDSRETFPEVQLPCHGRDIFPRPPPWKLNVWNRNLKFFTPGYLWNGKIIPPHPPKMT